MKICDECDTVAHCTKHGCVPKVPANEAMKLALEALEAGEYYLDDLEAIVYGADDLGTHEDRAKMQEAITALREALAEQPAQRKPLTDEEIDAIGAKIFSADFLDVEEIHANRDIARAIEAAHGIKGGA